MQIIKQELQFEESLKQRLELLENLGFGNRCLINATHRILDRLKVENTVYAKIEYFGRKEREMINSKA